MSANQIYDLIDRLEKAKEGKAINFDLNLDISHTITSLKINIQSSNQYVMQLSVKLFIFLIKSWNVPPPNTTMTIFSSTMSSLALLSNPFPFYEICHAVVKDIRAQSLKEDWRAIFVLEQFRICYLRFIWNSNLIMNLIFLKWALHIVKLELDQLGYNCKPLIQKMALDLPKIVSFGENAHPSIRAKSFELVRLLTQIFPAYLPIAVRSFVRYLGCVNTNAMELWWSNISDEGYTEVTFPLGTNFMFDRESLRHVLYTIGLAILRYLVSSDASEELREVLQIIDTKYDVLLLTHDFAFYLMRLNVDHDGRLVEIMSLVQTIHFALTKSEHHRDNSLPHIMKTLDKCTPHDIFLLYVTISAVFSSSNILDFLLTDDADFLEFFIKYLRFTLMHPNGLVSAAQTRGVELQDVMIMLETVRDDLVKLSNYGGVPFDASLLIIRLEQILSVLSIEGH